MVYIQLGKKMLRVRSRHSTARDLMTHPCPQVFLRRYTRFFRNGSEQDWGEGRAFRDMR
jgi:hypothetical protein